MQTRTTKRTAQRTQWIAGLLLAAMAAATGLAAEPPADPWVSMFDGKTLNGWKATKFGGEGDVEVKDGRIVLDFGASATGITWAGEFPKTNYEIRCDAMRVDGIDFFCALTFPVKDSHATFVVGGWSGGVVGISCIDYYDASENETTKYQAFKNGQWYKVRVVVTDEKIQAWIDNEQMVDLELEGHKLSVRVEVDLCKPLGIASWMTKAALKDIRYRRLPEEEKP